MCERKEDRGVAAVETLFVDGEWRPAASGERREIVDPADARTLVTVSEGGADDADAAVAAARRAVADQPSGRAMDAAIRAMLAAEQS